MNVINKEQFLSALTKEGPTTEDKFDAVHYFLAWYFPLVDKDNKPVEIIPIRNTTGKNQMLLDHAFDRLKKNVNKFK